MVSLKGISMNVFPCFSFSLSWYSMSFMCSSVAYMRPKTSKWLQNTPQVYFALHLGKLLSKNSYSVTKCHHVRKYINWELIQIKKTKKTHINEWICLLLSMVQALTKALKYFLWQQLQQYQKLFTSGEKYLDIFFAKVTNWKKRL